MGDIYQKKSKNMVIRGFWSSEISMIGCPWFSWAQVSMVVASHMLLLHCSCELEGSSCSSQPYVPSSIPFNAFLVGGWALPLWKIWVRQLGGWNAHILWKRKNVWNHQPAIQRIFIQWPFQRQTSPLWAVYLMAIQKANGERWGPVSWL